MRNAKKGGAGVRKYRELVELKGLLREKKVNDEALAKYLKMSISALSNKINGKSSFNLVEVEKIIRLLGVSSENIAVYFF